MPAINPVRLKQETAALAEYFRDPPVYVRQLRNLFETYANPSHRSGQAADPPPLLSSYRVQPPVLRQLLASLIPLVKADPEAGLNLCDLLWEQPYLEFRLLAAMLLGQVPCHPSQPVMARLKDWLKPGLEQRVLDALLGQGTLSCYEEDPQVITELLEEWLEQDQLFYKQLGLRIMLVLLRQPSFENLPVFFRIIQPYCRELPAALRADVLDVVIALARRSPQETAFFLRQTLGTPNSKDTPWLVRQSLSVFPAPQQESLRRLVRELPESKMSKS